jgi:AraC-like DNA-binding protein
MPSHAMNSFRRNMYLLLVTLLCQGPLHASTPRLSEYTNPALEAHIERHQYEEAKRIIENKLTDTAEMADHTRQAYYQCRNSNLYFKTGKFPQALNAAQTALRLATDSILIAESKLAYAYAANMSGQFELTMQYASEVLTFAEAKKLPYLLRDAMFLFGSIAMQNGNFREALAYYRKAYHTSREFKLHQYQHADLMNIGSTFMFLNTPDSALYFLDQSLDIALQRQDLPVVAGCYSMLAACAAAQNDIRKQVKYIQLSIEIAGKIQNPVMISSGYYQLQGFELSANNYGKAIQYGLLAKASLKKDPLPLLEVYVDSLLYQAYKVTGQIPEALRHFESYQANKTKILNIEQASKLKKLEHEFEIKEKNLTIQNQQLQVDIAQKRLLALALFNFSILFVVLASALFIWMKKKFRTAMYSREKMFDLLFFPVADTADEEVQHPEETHTEALPDQYSALFKDMIMLIESQKLYLNPKLDLKQVITMLGTNKFYLYNAINKNSESNFRNIINRYRVEVAKNIIEQECTRGESGSSTNIYVSSGFNSAASYYRIFKQHTGLTPMEYAREYMNDPQRLTPPPHEG